jgi:hypothetical protein
MAGGPAGAGRPGVPLPRGRRPVRAGAVVRG